MQRGLIAEIDLTSLVHNLSIVRSLAGSSKVIAVVKADAYGHGAVEVSRTLTKNAVDMLAVAYCSEAILLRENGISTPIISLFDAEPEEILRHNITPVLSNIKQAHSINRAASKADIKLKVHLKVDTGMGRTGFQAEDYKDMFSLFGLSNIEIEGIMSHFSEADLADKDFAYYQIGQMVTLKKRLSEEGINVRLWHISNSAAVISIPEANLDAVRPGLMLYGCSPFADVTHPSNALKASSSNLRPVMSVCTKILQVRRVRAGRYISYGRTFMTKRDSLIAVLPVGYADGINRLFSNNLEVLVSGKRAPVVGRVCMDTTMIDVTDIGNISEGSAVVILGSQAGETITAHELASRINTIPYEILTTLGSHARRGNLLSCLLS